MNQVLAEIARALGARLFADPVMIGGIPVPRTDARAAERALLRARKRGTA